MLTILLLWGTNLSSIGCIVLHYIFKFYLFIYYLFIYSLLHLFTGGDGLQVRTCNRFVLKVLYFDACALVNDWIFLKLLKDQDVEEQLSSSPKQRTPEEIPGRSQPPGSDLYFYSSTVLQT